jgi:hypothetical protein
MNIKKYMKQRSDVLEMTEHGLVMRISDSELADNIDDYLAEKCYVFYETKFGPNYVEFYFGQLGDPARLLEILKDFNLNFM